jgi:hypothetical protein
MDNLLDLTNVPAEITVPSQLTADLSQEQQADVDAGTQTMISFPFCLLYNQQPWQTIIVAAPSPELAQLTVDQLVQLLNKKLKELGYQPLCSSRLGAC